MRAGFEAWPAADSALSARLLIRCATAGKGWRRGVRWAGLAAALALAEPASAGETPCEGQAHAAAESASHRAEQMMDRALRALDKPPRREVKILTAWFGPDAAFAPNKIRRTLLMSRNVMSGAVYRCLSDAAANHKPVDIYFRPDLSYAIGLGDKFWTLPSIGRNSQPGAVIRQAVRVAITLGPDVDPDPDEVRAPLDAEAARRLAREAPAAAQGNPDNYRYFVEALAFRLD